MPKVSWLDNARARIKQRSFLSPVSWELFLFVPCLFPRTLSLFLETLTSEVFPKPGLHSHLVTKR